MLPRACAGFSYLELSIVICIVLFLSLTALPQLFHINSNYKSKRALRQIELAIIYARSIANTKEINVTICPSSDAISCTQDWSQGVLVKAGKSVRFFSMDLPKKHWILLHQSGKTVKKVEVQVDGFCNNNGHFSIFRPNPSEFSPLHLYFNKALRTYIRCR